MRSARLLLLALVGLALPAGLALAVYATSANSLASPVSAARVPSVTLGQPTTPPATTQERADDSGRAAGRCDEPEHRSDPECGASGSTVPASPPRTTSDDGRVGGDDGSSPGRGRGRGRGRSGSGDSGSSGGSGSSDSSGGGSGSSGSSDDSGGGGSDSGDDD